MAQLLPVMKPQEPFALSASAGLDEIREFLRLESLERMQLCKRLQKQQELLDHLSEGVLYDVETSPLKTQELGDRNQDPGLRIASFIAAEGTWRKQLGVEVDALKMSVENLTQDVKELQESLDPVDGCRSEPTNSLVLSRVDGKVRDDREDDREGELDRSFKVADGASDAEAVESDPVLDLQWLEERFEEMQKNCLSELSQLEDRLMEDFGNLKGFVDAAIVAMVSRMSTLEIFVKGEGGLIEKLEDLKQISEKEHVSPERVQRCEESIGEVNERMMDLEKRVASLSDRPHVGTGTNGTNGTMPFSPAPGCRLIKPRGIESSGAASEKHPEALSPQCLQSHGPVLQVNTPVASSVPHVPPGSLKVAPQSWGSPVQPIFRLQGASSSQLVTVLATPRSSSPTREVRPMTSITIPTLPTTVPGRSVTPNRGVNVVRAPPPAVVRF